MNNVGVNGNAARSPAREAVVFIVTVLGSMLFIILYERTVIDPVMHLYVGFHEEYMASRVEGGDISRHDMLMLYLPVSVLLGGLAGALAIVFGGLMLVYRLAERTGPKSQARIYTDAELNEPRYPLGLSAVGMARISAVLLFAGLGILAGGLITSSTLLALFVGVFGLCVGALAWRYPLALMRFLYKHTNNDLPPPPSSS